MLAFVRKATDKDSWNCVEIIAQGCAACVIVQVRVPTDETVLMFALHASGHLIHTKHNTSMLLKCVMSFYFMT